MKEDKELKKKCIVCKANIDPEATLCPTCSNYQKKWKNELEYWGKVVGGIVIIASLITFLWTAIPKAFFKDRVSILAFDNNRITLSNEGFGQLYISSLRIDSLDLGMLQALGYTLDVGEVIDYEVKPYMVWPEGSSFTYISDCTDEEWKNFLERGRDENDECFYLAFYLKGGTTITTIKEKIKKLRTFEGRGILEFYSNRKRRFFLEEFDLLGVVLRNNSQECLFPLGLK